MLMDSQKCRFHSCFLNELMLHGFYSLYLIQKLSFSLFKKCYKEISENIQVMKCPQTQWPLKNQIFLHRCFYKSNLFECRENIECRSKSSEALFRFTELVLCTRHCFKFYMCINSYNNQESHGVGTIFIPILQIRTRRPREMKQLGCHS